MEISGETGLKIFGDRDALKQILLIALDNALKHSEADIKVSATRQGAWIELRVQDFGEGIPSEKLDHLFDRFYRGEEASTIQGFGLGLPIAKALAEAQGGEIHLKSMVGQGTVVLVRFPSTPITA